MDYPAFIVCSFMENSIGLKWVKTYPANILSWKCHLFIMSAAYIQMHSRKRVYISWSGANFGSRGTIWTNLVEVH